MKSNFEGKRYSSKQRKIHKLKRENVKLTQKRKALFKYVYFSTTCEDALDFISKTKILKAGCLDILVSLSEQIGKNSAKIQRLRTQIQQEKKLDEYSNCS